MTLGGMRLFYVNTQNIKTIARIYTKQEILRQGKRFCARLIFK